MRGSAGVGCFFAQAWNVRPAKRGTGASRCSPTVFSPISRTSLLRSVQLASGATGVPARPAQVGRAMIRSRSLKPVCSLSRARACELISAMWTPCGQTWVQIPQPEQ